MGRQTFSISFFIKRQRLRKNNEAPVIMRITMNGERAEVSIQRGISPEHWNSGKGRARSGTLYGKTLNEYLDQTRVRVYQCQQELI